MEMWSCQRPAFLIGRVQPTKRAGTKTQSRSGNRKKEKKKRVLVWYGCCLLSVVWWEDKVYVQT